ncbi:MAG TPA: vitamin B12 dependent-methionine synthase activation domain-containing protein, partial [Solirubrobacteraceae bacterium]|nr:vitamin B12 dependent-methionine synthase activation domain-containing protein [Solirubrobacteraceae bacterium]
DFGLRILYPKGKESDEIYEPGVFYCKDAFEGLAKMDQLIDPDARTALVEKTRTAGVRLRRKGPEPAELPTTDDTVRSAARTDTPVPEPPYWGVHERDVDLEEIYPHLDTHVLFKLHWGGRGVKGEAWRELIEDNFQPRLERMWNEQDYLDPRAKLGYFPCYSEGNELVVLDPVDRTTIRERLVFPRQPRHDRICLADFYRPRESGELDVVAIQAVTVGDDVTDVMASLEADGEYAEQLFTHGLGVQTAEGIAEWMHQKVRTELGIGATQGRRYSWGYGAVPDQSEHEKIFRLLDAPEIGLRLSGGHALLPEQSTMAIVAHHPQAVYFGMKSGFLPSGEPPPDDVVHGSQRDPTRGITPDAIAPSEPRTQREEENVAPTAVEATAGA